MRGEIVEPKNCITDVKGIKVGHAQNREGATGCTVILCEGGAKAGVDVRGGAPGSRELALLDPVNLIDQVHAIYLSGGSAFGLDGAAGVMEYLEKKQIGIDTGQTRVPIVPGAVLFDLLVGDPFIRPDKEMGITACEAATEEKSPQGNTGAGTGAAVGRVAGPARFMKGGVGCASRIIGSLTVGALVAVNCVGDVVDECTGKILAGTLNERKDGFADSTYMISHPEHNGPNLLTGNTTLGVIATNARFSKVEATKVAMMAHDGFARSIRPIHTMHDGDTIFCLSVGEEAAEVSTVGTIAAEVMSEAIVNAVVHAETAYGVLSYTDFKQKQK